MVTARSAENCVGALTWMGVVIKESQSGAQRSNRIIDSAMRDAAPDGNLICVVEIVISSQNGRHQRD